MIYGADGSPVQVDVPGGVVEPAVDTPSSPAPAVPADAPRTRVRSTAYHAAGSGRRAKNWNPSRSSASAILARDLPTLRARSRDAVRNFPYGAQAIETLTAHLVGTGIRPRMLEEDQELRDQVQKAWDVWVDEADADGRCSLYGLQALVARSMAEGGDVLVRKRRRRISDGLSVPLQLQVLEGEHLPVDLNQKAPNGNTIRNGIEFNSFGRRAAYWLLPGHPGDTRIAGTAALLKAKRVPAREILHIYSPLRPGQTRGVPWLATILTRLMQLDQYDDAQLARQHVAALFSGFIIQDTDEEDDFLGGDDAEPDADGDMDVTLEPGVLHRLRPGQDFKNSNPPEMGTTYESWMKQNLRAMSVGSGPGITYEQMTGDYEGVTFSSLRAAILEFRRRCEMHQHNILVFQLCRPVLEAWSRAAMQAGVIPADGFAENPQRFGRARWVPQGWRWVDPLKEVTAAIMAIRAGLASREDVAAGLGVDVEELDRQLKEDNDRADDLGLVLDSDPRRTSTSGLLQQWMNEQTAPDLETDE